MNSSRQLRMRIIITGFLFLTSWFMAIPSYAGFYVPPRWTLHSVQAAEDDPVVNRLHSQAPELTKSVLKLAVRAYQRAEQHGLVHRKVLAVIDYSLPSTKKRLWVFDMKRSKLNFYTFVAHGRNSGKVYAREFSDVVDSKQTSLGLYITDRKPYYGSLGYALRLNGLEPGFNDKANQRAIVIHGAPYVSPEYIQAYGYLGRSWGCPAVDDRIIHPFVDTLKGGAALFAYYPLQDWLLHSAYV